MRLHKLRRRQSHPLIERYIGEVAAFEDLEKAHRRAAGILDIMAHSKGNETKVAGTKVEGARLTGSGDTPCAPGPRCNIATRRYWGFQCRSRIPPESNAASSLTASSLKGRPAAVRGNGAGRRAPGFGEETPGSAAYVSIRK